MTTNTIKARLGATNVKNVTYGTHEGNEVIRIRTVDEFVFLVEVAERSVSAYCTARDFYFEMATTRETDLLNEALKAIVAYL